MQTSNTSLKIANLTTPGNPGAVVCMYKMQLFFNHIS